MGCLVMLRQLMTILHGYSYTSFHIFSIATLWQNLSTKKMLAMKVLLSQGRQGVGTFYYANGAYYTGELLAVFLYR